MSRRLILTPEQIDLKMSRMALDIAARQSAEPTGNLTVLGIQGNGWLLAQLMAAELRKLLQGDVQVGMIEMNKKDPLSAIVPEQLLQENASVLVCDDVSNSGQTLLYGIRPLLSLPLQSLHCLVLVERMHNLFPVRADYNGLQLATAPTDYIEVEAENGQFTGAWLRQQ